MREGRKNMIEENKIRKIPDTDLNELTVHDMKFYSMDEQNFISSIEILKEIPIRELPNNIDIWFKDVTQKYSYSTLECEYPDFSIYLEIDGKCRVAIQLDFPTHSWTYDIDTTLFLELKRDLILLHKEEHPVIENDAIDAQFLVYSIEGVGDTVGEVIANAAIFNEKISHEIMNAIIKIPRLLRDSLGIKETYKFIAKCDEEFIDSLAPLITDPSRMRGFVCEFEHKNKKSTNQFCKDLSQLYGFNAYPDEDGKMINVIKMTLYSEAKSCLNIVMKEAAKYSLKFVTLWIEQDIHPKDIRK